MSSDKRATLLKFIAKQGIVRPSDIAALGISAVYLNKLYREGLLERPSRGIYTVKGAKVDQHQTLLEACKRIPRGIVCLLSALQFHGLTTQLPFEVWLAIDVKAHRPQGDLPPVRICRFSKAALEFEIQKHKIGNSVIRVYSPAKTVADCFKYRNKIGLDVAIEALRAVWSNNKASMDDLYKAAKVCRVANVMRPYLESIV
ncbi:MAG: type IV toxin-antitoxin system AbiEi family antitoxin domain-containing protein [Pseudomonadota bacterium]|jgi:predicted transcriptional regulator of viral defense system